MQTEPKIEPLIAEYKRTADLEIAAELASRISLIVQKILFRRVKLLEHRDEIYSILMTKIFNPNFLHVYDEKKASFATYIETVSRNLVATYFKEVHISKKRIIAISGAVDDRENNRVYEIEDTSIIPEESKRFALEILRKTGIAVYSLRVEMHRQIYITFILCRTEIQYETLAYIFDEKVSNIKSILHRCKVHVSRSLQKQFSGNLDGISDNDYRAAAEMLSDFHYWSAPLQDNVQLSVLAELSSLGSIKDAAINLGITIEKAKDSIRKAVGTISIIEPQSSDFVVKEYLIPYTPVKGEQNTTRIESNTQNGLKRLEVFVDNLGKIILNYEKPGNISEFRRNVAEPENAYELNSTSSEPSITAGLEASTIVYLLKAFE